MKLVFVLSVLFLANQASTEKVIYRSDQFRPGVISEYIQVQHSEKRDSILAINYWSTYRANNLTESTEIEIVQLQNIVRYKGEEHGWKGELKFLNTDEWLPFRMVEGVFKIEHPESEVQTFEMEK